MSLCLRWVLRFNSISASSFLIALIFYKLISLAHRGRPKKRTQSDVDREQNEKIEEISKETKKALALQDELDSLRERLGVPKEE